MVHSNASFFFGQKKVIRLALALLINLSLVCGDNVSYAIQDQQKVEETVRLIKTVSQEEVADVDSVIIIRPFFVTGRKNGISWLDYDFGGVAVDHMGLPPSDPYRLPYVMQLQVEALRKMFEENAGQKNFWRQHLDSAERLVRLTVEDIESTPERKKLDAKLSERSKAFQGVLGALDKSIKAEIKSANKSANWQIGEPGVGRKTRFGEKEAYSVRVLTEPEGGKVRVITAFVWRTCVKKGCNKEQLIWRSLNVGGTEGLIGGYHYIAEWSDGGKDEDDIKIDSEQERKFRPFKRQ